MNFDHIVGGDYNPKARVKGIAEPGKVTGGHSTLRGDVRVREVHGQPDKHGVYQATVEIKKPDGTWQVKSTPKGEPMTSHTMFPKHWDEARVRREVESAWKSRQMITDKKWQGISSSGVPIEGYISPNKTAYPIYIQKGN